MKKPKDMSDQELEAAVKQLHKEGRAIDLDTTDGRIAAKQLGAVVDEFTKEQAVRWRSKHLTQLS